MPAAATKTLLAPLTCALALALPVAGRAAPAADAGQAGEAVAARPRIGLVLGGGGARGAAHIGVLEVLQRLRVPVDCVAGTSMGALMAGAWASGHTPGQLAAAMQAADWADMFQDDPDYRELDFRHKRQLQRYVPGSETGLREGETLTPPGVVLGQKIQLFFNHLLGAEAGEPRIETLPLPLSIIATDIATGERVVFREGSLAQAMRASMAVPGLIAPLEVEGRKLVDGGLVDNLPVREVRERCGAQVVIAVDVGSPPLRPEQISGLLSVTAQMIALLTDQNVKATLATLEPEDVYIQPELPELGAADFARHAEAAVAGRAAAEALAARLAPLGLDEAAYAAWQRAALPAGPHTRPAPIIDTLEVAGLQRVHPALVRRHLDQGLQQPVDGEALRQDLMAIYGDGHYERVDYRVHERDGRHVLTVLPIEKSWGPDYLRLGVQIESNFSQGSTYQLRAAHQRTWLNALGGELLLSGELGSRSGLGLELYQPLSPAQRLFASAAAGLSRERIDYFAFEQRIAIYSNARRQLDLNLGLNFGRLGQARAGWREARHRDRLDTGIDIFQVLPRSSSSGWTLELDLDQLDRRAFPRRGWAAHLDSLRSPSGGYQRLRADLRGALPAGPWVYSARASWVGASHGELPLAEAGRLGGFFNLTAHAPGQFIGDRVAYGQLRAERIIGSLPLGLRGDMRLGAALEAGRVGRPYALQRDNGTLGSLAVYLGGETPLGPAYIGLGLGERGAANAYLFVGTP